MAKYIIDEATLTGLANALRTATGKEQTFTPEEMITEVTNILDSATYILIDENGTEVPAVFVENEVVFDATANDIRLGKIAATGDGVTEGTKEIPRYVSSEGAVRIPAGEALTINMFSDLCQYTKLQAIVCAFNTSPSNSVAAEKVSINDQVYAVNSPTPIATVSVDAEHQAISFGLTNTSDSPVVIRYFTFKEEE